MRVHFETVGGARTRYYLAGSGPLAMLVHGVGMSSDSWFMNIEALARTHTVCAPDLLGNAFTEAGPYKGGPPMPFYVDHLIALADHLGFKTFSLVGSSLGSGISALLYFKAPDRVEKLVLVGPGSMLNPYDESATPLAASYKNGRAVLDDPSFASCRERLARVFYDPAAVPAALCLMQLSIYALPDAVDSFELRMRGLADKDGRKAASVYDRLPEIASPSLVILGKQDIRGNLEQDISAARRIPASRTLIYDRCGHWPHMEHPEDFNRDVSAFLNETA